MRVIAVANQKGGCGKTTTAINFAACLAFLQKKILLMDLDPQGHSTCGLGLESKKISGTLYDVLKGDEPSPNLSRILHEVEPNVFVAPSSLALSELEEQLLLAPDRDKRLKEELARVSDHQNMNFDFALIDCPPNLGILTANAFEAADEVIIPIEPSFFSLHGLAKISETIQRVNQRRDRPLRVHALLVIFDSRTSFAKEVYDDVKAHFKEKLFTSIIHECVALKEAASAGKSIVRYNRQSTAFRDYLNLAMEYLEHEWDRLLPESELGWKNFLAHRFGPKRVAGGILFQTVSKTAHGIEIAGDFNHWVPEPLVRRDEEGLWQKIVPITQGSFRYKFIIDGEWQMDPYQPMQKENAFGTYDSYLEIR